MQNEVKVPINYAIVAAVQLPNVPDLEFDASLTELRELAKTLGYTVTKTFTQKRASFDMTAYLGAGKRDEIRLYVNDEVHNMTLSDATNSQPIEINTLLVDHEISPSQARNLEKEVGCEVMDRTMVILEIFHRNAKSRAARAQVEIARLGYMAPRLREAAKLAGPQGRQRSGEGGRGAGESHTELDRRKIRDRIAELNLEIVAMDVERQTQRARRQTRQSVANVALVGYTNAGKSTIMRALTNSDVLVANKLFATLDTTVRSLYPESVPRVLVSDTVGFIKNLPHGLVASFKSTLDEALDATLLLHVIDASDVGFERQIEVTDDVLKDIGADNVPKLRVFNKIDYVDGLYVDGLYVGNLEAQTALTSKLLASKLLALKLQEKYPNCIVMSARNSDDISKLHQTIVNFFQQDLLETELFLPWANQQLRGQIYASCQVLNERSSDDGTFLTVRGELNEIQNLQAQLI